MGKKLIGYGNFFCWNCGARIEKGKQECPNCAVGYGGKTKYGDIRALGACGIGWSDQSGHPCFQRYIKNYCRYAYIWLISISILIPAGLLFSGELGFDFEGLVVAGVVVGLLWVVGAFLLNKQYGKDEPDWDGVVENKQILQNIAPRKDNDGNKFKEAYTEFVVSIRRQDGSLYDLTKTDNSTKYDYYRIGDYVHYHGNKFLKYLEKYDKSLDTVIFCASCHKLCDIHDNFCESCGSILLKGVTVTQKPPHPVKEYGDLANFML